MTKHLSLSQLMASSAIIPAISYIRVSSDKQLVGEGLARQRQGTLAWIAKHPEMNIRLDDEAEDAARSAWKGDHVKGGALGSILQQVKLGVIRPPMMLIVEGLDRLSRQDEKIAQEQLLGLINNGILVATTMDDKVYSSDSDLGDLIISIVKMSAAHAHSETTSQRVHATKLKHVQEAMVTKQVLHQNCPAWMQVVEKISSTNRLTRKHELLDGPCASVLAIYQMGVKYGSDYITRWLIAHQDEHPAFGRSGEWSLRSVKKILRSRAVIGHLKSKHGMVMDHYPRVPGVSDALWLRVQAAQDQRRDTGAKTPFQAKHVNLLVSIGQCTECTGKMRVTEPHAGLRYYSCFKHAVKHSCGNTSVYRQDVIDDAILDGYGFGWLEPPKSATPAATSEVQELEAALEALQAERRELEAQLPTAKGVMLGLAKTALEASGPKIADATTRLRAVREQVEAEARVIKIKDMTDREEVASVLRQKLTAVRFLPDNVVELESPQAVLRIVARQDGGKPSLTFKCDTPTPPAKPIRTGAKATVVALKRRK